MLAECPSVCPYVCHALELRGNYVTYSKSENIVGKLDSSATTYVKVIIVVRSLHSKIEGKETHPRKKRKNVILDTFSIAAPERMK